VAAVSLRLPAGITHPGSSRQLDLEASTVREALEAAVAAVPQLLGRVLRDDGSFAIGVFVNGQSAKLLQGLQTPLADGDLLVLVPPIAGG
jgi:molybdopterin synthase sulfur carrier subunit